jgi:uncharacterized protein involved in exopolysaccharide biosynthesis/Mrp family chromosome partitioning ATPase
MTAIQRETQHHSGLKLSDILFALFKRKLTIMICAAVGIIAAAAVYFLYPPVYASQAKLLVRYVLERSGVDPIEGASSTAASSKTVDTVIGAEVAILTSWDLAVQVAQAIGPKRLLPRSGAAATEGGAAGTVSSGLTVIASKGSNIISVSYKNRDPQIAPLVLQELLSRYFIKHLEVHRSAGAFDFVTQQTDQVRTRLNQTEDALRSLRDKTGITSLKDGSEALTTEAAKIQEQLSGAEAELAEQQARVSQIGGVQPGASPSAEASKSDIEQYQFLTLRSEALHKTETGLLSKYTPASKRVKINQRQIKEVENQKLDLEKKFPDISAKAAALRAKTGGSQGKNSVSDRAHLAGIGAKIETLRSRLRDVQEKMKQLSGLGLQIRELERKRDLDEANYKYFAASLEKARIDEALDPSKMPNISAVQRPTPPMLETKTRDKIALGLAGGGTALGIALALLSGLILNRTVRRPLDLETQLRIPLMLSIPHTATRNGHLALPRNGSPANSEALATRPHHSKLAPWEAGHFIRPYCQAIRDRLGLYFEIKHLTHKPKLVGVAGFSEQAGTSTLAAGLAASLSETNDGKVLLVDINLGPEDVHQFFEGKPAHSLTAALKRNSAIASAADNLYLATVGSPNSGPAQLGLKRFFDMMPNLKASDFDYIIFDMPPLGQTSPTWGMAPFMDKLLLVVEAEKNNREIIKRGYRKLVAERDNVEVVVNKTRSYVPKWLDAEA